MAEEQKITLDLNHPVNNFEGEPIKDGARLVSGQKIEQAPILTRGILLASILMSGVQTDNGKTRARLNRLSKKIFSNIKNNNGKWSIDKDRLKELFELLDKLNPQSSFSNPQFHGDIYNMLEDAQEEFDKLERKQNTA